MYHFWIGEGGNIVVAVQCHIKTKHPDHEWRQDRVLYWCAGLDVRSAPGGGLKKGEGSG